MDRLLDGALGIPNMHRLQNQLQQYGLMSEHIVLGSESCHCPTTGYAGGSPEIYWSRAERYAHTILADLAAGSHGWVEWNLILDGIGGPNHLNNLCESTILAVPHRAVGMAKDYPPLPSFEKQKPFGNVSLGDGRTREELNALGFPAKFLDVGIAVQPIYFYMGHISRHVRPGSYAVSGLVQESLGNSSKVFRHADSVVMGGGQNDLARNGIELTVWPCEGSTRQQFKWNIDDRKHIQVYGHDWLGTPTTSCIGREPDVDLLGLRLDECDENHAGSFDVLLLTDDPDGRYVVKLLNPVKAKKRDECLVILELHNEGGAYGPRGGAQISLGDCESDAAKWSLDLNSGEASSNYFGDDVCLTTGWPFLQVRQWIYSLLSCEYPVILNRLYFQYKQMGAFQTPTGENTIVVLNEANDPANFALRDGDAVLLTSSIPSRSIQTIIVS
jgi:glucosylceramidase